MQIQWTEKGDGEHHREGEDRKIHYEKRKSNQRKHNNEIVFAITQEVQWLSLWMEQAGPEYSVVFGTKGRKEQKKGLSQKKKTTKTPKSSLHSFFLFNSLNTLLGKGDGSYWLRVREACYIWPQWPLKFVSVTTEHMASHHSVFVCWAPAGLWS